jgi:hypothetical protein
LKEFTKKQQEPKIRANEVISNYLLKHFVLTSLMLRGQCNRQNIGVPFGPTHLLAHGLGHALGEMESKRIRTHGTTSSPMISTTYPTTPYNFSTTPLLSHISLLYIMHHKHQKRDHVPSFTKTHRRTIINFYTRHTPQILAGTDGARRRGVSTLWLHFIAPTLIFHDFVILPGALDLTSIEI